MLVKELIAKLQSMPQDVEVVIPIPKTWELPEDSVDDTDSPCDPRFFEGRVWI